MLGLVVKLKDKLDLGELCPYKTFIDENNVVKMIELDQTISYFKEIIKFMVSCCGDDRIQIISNVLSSYEINRINHNNVDLLKLIGNINVLILSMVMLNYLLLYSTKIVRLF